MSFIEKLPYEILRIILNKLDINHLKIMIISYKSINNLNYKYFLVPYNIKLNFIGENEEIKELSENLSEEDPWMKRKLEEKNQ